MTTHKLKTHPAPFAAMRMGFKTFEFRRNDRDFQVGDTLICEEFVPCKKCEGHRRVWDNGAMDDCDCTITKSPGGKYTGRHESYEVTYMLKGPAFGMPEGFCVMSIKAIG